MFPIRSFGRTIANCQLEFFYRFYECVPLIEYNQLSCANIFYLVGGVSAAVAKVTFSIPTLLADLILI
jgi:hypothetical protein